MQLKTKRLETQKTHTTSESLTEKSPVNRFPIGSSVEVTSDEEGFRGVWFRATVLKPPISDRIYVEYDNLLSEENGSSLLREYVHHKFVRPRPPVDVDVDVVTFEADDVVDAYYQDGWWTGVVIQVVVPNSKYTVFFSNPPDQIEFDSSDLRVHRSWVNDSWVIPPKQIMRDLNFSPLTAVEVNIDPDNLPDIWLPATVIKKVGNYYFLVEYQNSREAAFQRIGVDSLHIRPLPPNSSRKTFSLLEKVDAFWDCRWLSGVVTKILADGRYIVYFKCLKNEKELSHKDLRLHMEWTNDKWVHSSLDTPLTSKSEKQPVHPNGGNNDKICTPCENSVVMKENNGHVRISAVTLRRHEKDLQINESEKADCTSITPSNKRNKHINAYGDAISLRSSRRSNEEEAVSDATLCPETCKSNVTQMAVLDNSVDQDTSPRDYQKKSNLKESEHSNQPSDSSNVKDDNEKHSVSRKRGRPRKLGRVGAETADETPTESDSVKSFGPTVDETRTKSDSVKSFGPTVDETRVKSDSVSSFGPIVIGLTHGKLIDSGSASSGSLLKVKKKKAVLNEKKQMAASADPESVETESQQEEEVTNLKRKRGRPPKVLLQLGSPMTNIEEGASELALVPENLENRRQDVDVLGSTERLSLSDEVEKHAAVVEPRPINNSSPRSDPRTNVNVVSEQFKRLADIRRLSVGKITARRQVRKHKKTSIAAPEKPENTCILRGKKLKSTKQTELPTEDGADSFSRGTVEHLDNGVYRDITAVAVTSSNASDDDQPLSVWLEGAHSPPPTNGRLSIPEIADQMVEKGDIQENFETLPCGPSKEKAEEEKYEMSVGKIVATKRDNEGLKQSSAIVPRENQELPFVKNSVVWGVIESMEVFKRIPQTPHFFPLYDCKEECREGLAIGSMVTFTSLAERISQARFDDPKSLFDGYLEALVDLEKLGFNVAPVRELLHKLISIKSSSEQAHNTSKEIESQIVEREHEKSKIDGEIAELEKKIMELKEKQAHAVSNKERKETEIAVLQSSVDAVKGVLGSTQKEFEKVAASLW